MVKTWLITGGNGFLGVNLRALLTEELPDDRVVVVDTGDHNKEFSSDRAKRVNVNVANWKAMVKIFDKFKPNYVVHLAAETGVRTSLEEPKKCLERNFMGALNCLDLAERYDCESVILASSCGVVGERFRKVEETGVCFPESPYATSKLCMEALGDCYQKIGLKVCNLRFSNIYGPWSEHKQSVVASFIKALLNGDPVRINGDGFQTRNFIYVKDAARAILTCLRKKACGTYCISSDKSITINDLVTIICEAAENDMAIEFQPLVDGEIINLEIDNSKARKELMFQCEYGMMEGIVETIQWFQQLKSRSL